ncbi:hypothetical protein EGJ15_11345 [Pseudomonas sp. p99-361]|nr:hypothetical protein EGJ15_11345 [Pseudomonas sp. p99-361]
MRWQPGVWLYPTGGAGRSNCLSQNSQSLRDSLWEITQRYGLGCHAENSVRKRDAAGVGAGVPAKNSTRWLAPAAPVFAGPPAPTRTV